MKQITALESITMSLTTYFRAGCPRARRIKKHQCFNGGAIIEDIVRFFKQQLSGRRSWGAFTATQLAINRRVKVVSTTSD